jgi:hypothetical protein
MTKGSKSSSNSKETDYAKRINNTAAHMIINLMVVKSFLKKYGYNSRWWKISDVSLLYDTYAILKCRNYE